MNKKVKRVEELMKPTKNRILVELLEEAKTYDNGITNINAGFEPYCIIAAIGNQVTEMNVGDIGLMRLNIKADVFKLYGKKYSVLTDFDITVIIDEEVKQEFKNYKIESAKPEIIVE